MRIAVAVPSIPPRAWMLGRALTSVATQTRQADEIAVVVDHRREGAAVTRNRAWRNTTADLVLFLDDDDELHPTCIERMEACQAETNADLVYAWPVTVGGENPHDPAFGQPWNPAEPVQTTIVALWRRQALERVGGFVNMPVHRGIRIGEDHRAVLDLNTLGGVIVHLPERLWTWNHHGFNTSGLPDRW